MYRTSSHEHRYKRTPHERRRRHEDSAEPSEESTSEEDEGSTDRCTEESEDTFGSRDSESLHKGSEYSAIFGHNGTNRCGPENFIQSTFIANSRIQKHDKLTQKNLLSPFPSFTIPPIYKEVSGPPVFRVSAIRHSGSSEPRNIGKPPRHTTKRKDSYEEGEDSVCCVHKHRRTNGQKHSSKSNRSERILTCVSADQSRNPPGTIPRPVSSTCPNNAILPPEMTRRPRTADGGSPNIPECRRKQGRTVSGTIPYLPRVVSPTRSKKSGRVISSGDIEPVVREKLVYVVEEKGKNVTQVETDLFTLNEILTIKEDLMELSEFAKKLKRLKEMAKESDKGKNLQNFCHCQPANELLKDVNKRIEALEARQEELERGSKFGQKGDTETESKKTTDLKTSSDTNTAIMPEHSAATTVPSILKMIFPRNDGNSNNSEIVNELLDIKTQLQKLEERRMSKMVAEEAPRVNAPPKKDERAIAVFSANTYILTKNFDKKKEEGEEVKTCHQHYTEDRSRNDQAKQDVENWLKGVSPESLNLDSRTRLERNLQMDRSQISSDVKCRNLKAQTLKSGDFVNQEPQKNRAILTEPRQNEPNVPGKQFDERLHYNECIVTPSGRIFACLSLNGKVMENRNREYDEKPPERFQKPLGGNTRQGNIFRSLPSAVVAKERSRRLKVNGYVPPRVIRTKSMEELSESSPVCKSEKTARNMNLKKLEVPNLKDKQHKEDKNEFVKRMEAHLIALNNVIGNGATSSTTSHSEFLASVNLDTTGTIDSSGSQRNPDPRTTIMTYTATAKLKNNCELQRSCDGWSKRKEAEKNRKKKEKEEKKLEKKKDSECKKLEKWKKKFCKDKCKKEKKQREKEKKSEKKCGKKEEKREKICKTTCEEERKKFKPSSSEEERKKFKPSSSEEERKKFKPTSSEEERKKCKPTSSEEERKKCKPTSSEEERKKCKPSSSEEERKKCKPTSSEEERKKCKPSSSEEERKKCKPTSSEEEKMRCKPTHKEQDKLFYKQAEKVEERVCKPLYREQLTVYPKPTHKEEERECCKQRHREEERECCKQRHREEERECCKQRHREEERRIYRPCPTDMRMFSKPPPREQQRAACKPVRSVEKEICKPVQNQPRHPKPQRNIIPEPISCESLPWGIRGSKELNSENQMSQDSIDVHRKRYISRKTSKLDDYKRPLLANSSMLKNLVKVISQLSPKFSSPADRYCQRKQRYKNSGSSLVAKYIEEDDEDNEDDEDEEEEDEDELNHYCNKSRHERRRHCGHHYHHHHHEAQPEHLKNCSCVRVYLQNQLLRGWSGLKPPAKISEETLTGSKTLDSYKSKGSSYISRRPKPVFYHVQHSTEHRPKEKRKERKEKRHKNHKHRKKHHKRHGHKKKCEEGVCKCRKCGNVHVKRKDSDGEHSTSENVEQSENTSEKFDENKNSEKCEKPVKKEKICPPKTEHCSTFRKTADTLPMFSLFSHFCKAKPRKAKSSRFRFGKFVDVRRQKVCAGKKKCCTRFRSKHKSKKRKSRHKCKEDDYDEEHRKYEEMKEEKRKSSSESLYLECPCVNSSPDGVCKCLKKKKHKKKSQRKYSSDSHDTSDICSHENRKKEKHKKEKKKKKKEHNKSEDQNTTDGRTETVAYYHTVICSSPEDTPVTSTSKTSKESGIQEKKSSLIKKLEEQLQERNRRIKERLASLHSFWRSLRSYKRSNGRHESFTRKLKKKVETNPSFFSSEQDPNLIDDCSKSSPKPRHRHTFEMREEPRDILGKRKKKNRERKRSSKETKMKQSPKSQSARRRHK